MLYGTHMQPFCPFSNVVRWVSTNLLLANFKRNPGRWHPVDAASLVVLSSMFSSFSESSSVSDKNYVSFFLRGTQWSKERAITSYGGNWRCYIMSQSIPTGYIPLRQPPRISSKNLPGGSWFDFWKLPGGGGGGEFDKDKDFAENEDETSKTAWIKFLQVKTKKDKLNFSRFRCSLSGIFPGLRVNFLVLLSITHTLQKIWGVASGLFIFEVFIGLWLSTPTFVQKVMIMLNVLCMYWFY